MMSRFPAPRQPHYIVLYDTPGHTQHAWAPNVWPIRFILNYKRLPYRTEWVHLPDVEATLRSINAPPIHSHRTGKLTYTLPVIVDAMRNPPVIISNESLIAEYLEATYPARPIFPEGSKAIQAQFVYWIQEVWARPLLSIMLPASHGRLPEKTQEHFLSQMTRGRPAAPYPHIPSVRAHIECAEREQAWMAVKSNFDYLAAVLDKNSDGGDGVVAMGRELSYADFAVCSMLIWIERMAPRDGWIRVRAWNGGRWMRLWERCREYMDEC